MNATAAMPKPKTAPTTGRWNSATEAIRGHLAPFFERCARSGDCFCSILRENDSPDGPQRLPRVLLFPRAGHSLRLGLVGGIRECEAETTDWVVDLAEFFLAEPGRLGSCLISAYPMAWPGDGATGGGKSLVGAELETNQFDLVLSARVHTNPNRGILVLHSGGDKPAVKKFLSEALKRAGEEGKSKPLSETTVEEASAESGILPFDEQGLWERRPEVARICFPKGWPNQLQAALFRRLVFAALATADNFHKAGGKHKFP